MKNTFLYIITVLIWGSTWIAIEFQIDEAPIQVSLFYRFALAAGIMWFYCLVRGVSLSFSRTEHFYIFLLALFNFSFNYLILYEAQKYLDSAMTSIAFSTLLLVNIINTRLFFGKPIKPRVYAGAIIGVIGLVTLFWPNLTAQSVDVLMLKGLGLAVGGTLVASLGNMVSYRNTQNDIPVLAANTWGMFYGALTMLTLVTTLDISFVLPDSSTYWVSLGFTAIFGTVIAFASYFILLNNLGPEKASYVIVLFPVVAIIISVFVEGFVLTNYVIAGFLLIALGNLVLLTPLEKISLRAIRLRYNKIRT